MFSVNKNRVLGLSQLVFVSFIVWIGFCFYGRSFVTYFNEYVVLAYIPFENIFNRGVVLGNVFNGYVRGNEHLLNRMNFLEKENELLRQNVQKLQYLDNRNEVLLNFLKFDVSGEMNKIVSRVVLSDGSKSIVIDKGSADNVKVGMTVVTPLGLVGRVYDVYDNRSVVMLITNSNSNVSSRIMSTRELVLIRGANNGVLNLKYVPFESLAVEGDLVSTSGVGIFEPDIIIGEIVSISEDKQNMEKNVIVKTAVNFKTLEEVIIIY